MSFMKLYQSYADKNQLATIEQIFDEQYFYFIWQNLIEDPQMQFYSLNMIHDIFDMFLWSICVCVCNGVYKVFLP